MIIKPTVLYALFTAASIANALYTASATNETSFDSVSPDLIFDGRNAITERELYPVLFINGTADRHDLNQREVYSPKITSPGSSTVWVAGTTAQVTWDTSNPPKTGGNYTSSIVLGHLEDGSDNEHLDVDHPLAQGFNLAQGNVDVTVPFVSPGNDYIIVLFGDSGNRSPTFTIN